MQQVLGALRMAGAAVWVAMGTIVVLLSGWLPLRIRGVRPAGWIVTGLARGVCRIMRVRILSQDFDSLRRHVGLIFPNHLSLLDPLVLLAVMPVRFVAATEVARYPLIGQLTKSIDTVFVSRHDRESRREARRRIAEAFQHAKHPPIVLFPEGRLGPGHRLYPFRYGAFNVAAGAGISFMPCGLRYQPLDVAVWHGGQGESLWRALWRLATSPVPVQVEVLPLKKVEPHNGADPVSLAEQTQRHLASVLGLPLEPMTPPPLRSPQGA